MYWTLLWRMISKRKHSGSEFIMITSILHQVDIPRTHRHGRIKKYTTKWTKKFTEKNYKMKRNTFMFKERAVLKKRRNIMNIMEKMTTNISPVYKKKGRKKIMIFCLQVRLSSGIQPK